MSKQVILKKLTDAILSFDKSVAVAAAQEALDAKVDPLEALEKGLKVGIDIVGAKFARDELFLPHLLMAADALNAAVDVLKKNISQDVADQMNAGTIVIATVKDDIHDVGKNILAALLSASGFEVYDVGKDVPVDTIIEKAVSVNADIIMASALMTTTMGRQKEILEELEFHELRDRFLVMVGGGPTTQEWADKIGADGYGTTAAGAVEVAKKLLSSKEL
jgi:corrinoid protein of di/trimethylamine methyltransferase